MGGAPSSRYDYEIPLHYDPSGTTSTNLLGSFQNILLLVNRSNLPVRTFYMTPYPFLTLKCELFSRSTVIPDGIRLAAVTLISTSRYEALTVNKRLMVKPDISYVNTVPVRD